MTKPDPAIHQAQGCVPWPIDLDLTFVQLHWRARGPLQLASFYGSALRGALGHALREFTCPTPCAGCGPSDLGGCSYFRYFEPRKGPSGAVLPGFGRIPPPLIWWPPAPGPSVQLSAGQALETRLVAVGEVGRRLGEWGPVWRDIGQRGFGRGRGQLDFEWLEIFDRNLILQFANPLGSFADGLDAGQPCIPPKPKSFRVIFETPLRLLDTNKRPVKFGARQSFSFALLARSLVGRLDLLAGFWGQHRAGWSLERLESATTHTHMVRADLHWYELSRFSSSQARKVPLGGLLGWLEPAGLGLEELWPALWIGQFVNAGKGASQGLGRYRLDPLPDR